MAKDKNQLDIVFKDKDISNKVDEPNDGISSVCELKKEYIIPGRTEIPCTKKGYDAWIRDFHRMNNMDLPEWYEKKMKTERNLKGMFLGILTTYGVNISDVLYKPKL